MPKDRKARWLVWGVYVALGTTLLALPARTIDRLPGRDIFASYKYFFAKSLHIGGYAVMTILCGSLHVAGRCRWLLIFFLMGHATVTEMIQYHVPALGRAGELN